jgi:ribosomal protein RSM22 (predicted rRNA methylase)
LALELLLEYLFKVQKYTFPANYQPKIEALLSEYQYSLEKPKVIADAVLKLADHYQTTTRITPWKTPEFVAAYAAYYFPLNYVRSLRIWGHAQDVGFPNDFSQVIDFGCGLGSALLAARDLKCWNTNSTLFTVDHMATPVQLQKKYFLTSEATQENLPTNFNNTLGIFSYSLNELSATPDWMWKLDHIYIAEPSTSVHARRLMELRSTLIERGYSIWAPCTHHSACPLLVESKTDWCHDRIHWEQPEWFQKIEQHLPIKNQTLTTSYLLASKTPPRANYFGRIVGDELLEKGKTRWMFCQNEKREFLSHLDRYGDAPQWKRGHLFKEEIPYESKGNELRIR